MEQTTSTQAEIQDDLPTWHSELHEWWEKRIKPFIDLGSFLRQRRQILQHPELTYSDKAPDKEWKKPFEFALSATILTFTFIALIGLVFRSVFPDPDLKHDWITRKLTSVVTSTGDQLRHMSPRDPRYAGIAATHESAKSDLEFHTSGSKVPHGEVYTTVGVPLIIYLLGVIFPFFMRYTHARSAPRAKYVREIVYYYFAARTFWPMFLLAISFGAISFAMKYSAVYAGGDQFNDMLPVHRGAAYYMLAAAVVLIGLVFLYGFYAAPVVIHKAARQIPTLLGIQERATHIELYWAIWLTFILSVMLAMLLATLLVWGYMGLDAGTDALHRIVGHAISTT